MRYRPPHLLLQWHLTDRCNLRCAHCYQDTYAGPELSLPELLTILTQFEQFLRTSAAPGNAPIHGQITVTGGEPFMYPDFWPLLEHLAVRRDLFRVAILTNGTLLDETLALRLRQFDLCFVQVSLEGLSATHDRIRGAGSFDKAVKGLQGLVRAKIPAMIAFTAQRSNFREFADVARLGRQLKVARVWTDRLIPQGRQQAQLQAETLTPEETRAWCELIATERAAAHRAWFGRTEIAAHRALQFLAAGGRPYRCTAGDTLLTIMPNGDLYPCRRLPIRIGNVLETPLAELYEHELLRSLRDRRIAAACQPCLYAQFCRGGLRCLAYATTGDPLQPDPGCWHVAQKEETVT